MSEGAAVAHHEDAISKGGVAVRSARDIRNAARSIAADRNGVAERPETAASCEFEARLDRHAIAGAAETVFAADQVARRNALIAARYTERDTAQFGNRIRDAA